MRPLNATALLAVTLATMIPAAAHAATAPANDDRADAAALTQLPTSVTGTTVGATVEHAEPRGECAAPDDSVWYEVKPHTTGRIVVSVAAHGKLDLVVDVFKQVRSQTESQTCDVSDDNGNAATEFNAAAGDDYLIRVGERSGSESNTFSLNVSAPIAPAQPPGKALHAAGVTRTLDRFQNPDDAWSYRFRVGVSYRIHLSSHDDHCTAQAAIFEPGTRSFADDDRIMAEMRCGQYRLFTPGPGQGGRYSLRVLANRNISGAQHYHLQVAPAGPDDTAPGLALRTGVPVRGVLHGDQIDMLDLYRFTITRRSVTYLRLAGGHKLFLQLVNQRGTHLGSGDASIRTTLAPGHYYVVVRANGDGRGHYRLTRIERVVTRTRTSLGGDAHRLTAKVTTTPASAGRYVVTFERYDPLAGWLFAREVHVTGTGTVCASYDPPGPGKYRARAVYLGGRDAAGSRSPFTRFEVADRDDT
jgi:hypothetical protein